LPPNVDCIDQGIGPEISRVIEMNAERPTTIELSNEELDVVAGGDKTTNGTKTTKTTKGSTVDNYLAVTLTEVQISS
jgi:hypothetical protein